MDEQDNQPQPEPQPEPEVEDNDEDARMIAAGFRKDARGAWVR